MNYKVLIADDLAQEGVEILEAAGDIAVDYRKSTSREELLEAVSGVDALIVRSASMVDLELIKAADCLKVVIRAGVGVDNIDISACSQRGIVVMNAPAGNSISTAEQALALLFALARKIPLASASMNAGKWEKKKLKGVQLTGKTLGVIGLGRIGKEVVKRAKGLQMRVIAYDPYIPKENLEYLNIDICGVDELLQRADIISVHTPLTDATRNLVNESNLSKLKKGVFLLNAARGGIYNEQALYKGLEEGIIGGVGLDVFTQEPIDKSFPLIGHPKVILTPHLGASTEEAFLEVAKETATSVVSFLKKGVAYNSLNFPTINPNEMDVLLPWFQLVERSGNFVAQISGGPIKSVSLAYGGELKNISIKPLEIALLKGALSPSMGDGVNLVNAPVIAKERGIHLSIRKLEEKQDVVVINVEADKKTEVRAVVNFSGGTIIGVNGLPLEFKPQGHILQIINRDVPRVVGELGRILGGENINIAALQLSRKSKGGEVMTILTVDDPIPKAVLEAVKGEEFIIEAKYIFISDDDCIDFKKVSI